MKALVSVLIPVYQSEKYLEQCVESVLGQTYSELEIILIDDGSTDGSGILCDKLAKQHENIKVFHQINRGVSAARNKALELAEGRYIIFVDSDDYLEKDIIQNVISNYRNNDIDLCVFGFQMVSLNTYTQYTTKIPYSTDKLLNLEEVKANILDLYSTYVLHAIGTKIYKRSIIEKYGLRFKENWEYNEDIFYCLSYINVCNKSIVFMKDVGYYYRVGNYESLSYRMVSNKREPVFETFYLLKHMLGDDNWSNESKQIFYKFYESSLTRIETKDSKTTKQADKFRKMFLAMNKWMNNYLKGKKADQFLLQKGYHSVAIYGMNYMGKTLLEELKGSKVNVEYAIDRNADNISVGLKIFKPCEDLPKVDAIIVTSISSYMDIRRLLEQKGAYNIISLEEIIEVGFSGKKHHIDQ